MGESDGGKSTLLHAIMGNLNRIQGDIKYSGKVGYLPQKLWFRKATVKQNILFGLPFNKDKLKKIYRIVMLANELPLLTKGEETVIKDLSNITDSQKRRIALARVLYS
jgi:ATP-binding cassette subfamily C (CFTR/MRP) protein 1